MKSDFKMEKKLCSDQNANIDLFLFGHIMLSYIPYAMYIEKLDHISNLKNWKPIPM